MIRTYTKEYGLPEIRVLPSGEKQNIFSSVTMVYRSSHYDVDHEDRFINAGLYRDTREVVELEFSPKLLNTGFVIPKIKRGKQDEDGEKVTTSSKKKKDSSSRKRKQSCFREADEVKTQQRKRSKKRALVQGYPSASATTSSKDKHSKATQSSGQAFSLERSKKRKSLSLPSATGRKLSKLDK